MLVGHLNGLAFEMPTYQLDPGSLPNAPAAMETMHANHWNGSSCTATTD